ncbi:MAG: hypothetical protein JWO19_1689 [Bryobacterales bacterium]|nr:hypothetical protein [Bryobacterales bacterium]
MDLNVTYDRQWSLALWYPSARFNGAMLQYEDWICVSVVNSENREASLPSDLKISLESCAAPFCRSHVY